MKRIKRDLPIYVLSAALVFLGVAISTQSANAGTKTDAHIKNLEKYTYQLDACLYGVYFGMDSVFADTPSDSRTCQAILGKLRIPNW